MKRKRNKYSRSCVLSLLIILLSACQNSGESSTLYYAIESDGTIYGYVETTISKSEDDGNPMVLVKSKIRSISTALGMNVDTQVDSELHVDEQSGRFSDYILDVDQGSIQILISATMTDDSVLITQNMGGGTKKVPLPPDGILSDFGLYPRLLKDFRNTGLESKTYQILDLIDREFQKHTFTYQGSEQLELAGKTFETLKLAAINHEIGGKAIYWIDAATGENLKNEVPGLQTTRLTDKSVKKKLRRFNRDAHILARAGIMIQDYQNLSYLKVKATLDPIGNWITPESLNVRGQTFRGTVTDNHVEGTFEISHLKYSGENPPPFPADYSDNPELKAYLEPQDFIESEDPVLIAKAQELTAGAGDSWEASKRLAEWVAEEIGYAIPGGGSARNTYELRNGECGAHSRLYTAFCRAVGIPSRVVWGCMYIPSNDGSFGQHGWNEVYMGDAGWITIDTTTREIDFCDSGHIRLGILDSSHIAYNPQEFEILDFKAGSQSFADVADSIVPSQYLPYVGKYQGPKRNFTIKVQNQKLAVDVPGRMVFELREPDDQGRWYFVITPDVHITFTQNEARKVTAMTMYNQPQIPKKKQDGLDLEHVPEELRPYCGTYPVPGQGDISVFFRNKRLAIKLPPNQVLDLQGPDEEGMWRVENRSDKFSFVKDEEGNVRAITIHEIFKCKKLD